ncbi:hypothetical protein IC619_008275 [Hazenella sp. IB182353]|uniref:hypothetical protein n=1 Tax=Polycladospora coralii TaxID=2771432 RepID=UPI001746F4D6|nr:hypothetical protein [Polycladospora coralii]MBS7530484.1 hypothetical protein [Polycladospora coralii]
METETDITVISGQAIIWREQLTIKREKENPTITDETGKFTFELQPLDPYLMAEGSN